MRQHFPPPGPRCWQPQLCGSPGVLGLLAVLCPHSSPSAAVLGASRSLSGPSSCREHPESCSPTADSPEHERGGSALCVPPDYNLITSSAGIVSGEFNHAAQLLSGKLRLIYMELTEEPTRRQRRVGWCSLLGPLLSRGRPVWSGQQVWACPWSCPPCPGAPVTSVLTRHQPQTRGFSNATFYVRLVLMVSGFSCVGLSSTCFNSYLLSLHKALE